MHFVCPRDRIWPELLNWDGVLPPKEQVAERAVDGVDVWTVRTAYEFRKRGVSITISDRPDPRAINVTHVSSLGRRNRGLVAFWLAARADGHDNELANYLLLQNRSSVSRLPHGEVQHWLQPNLKPRDPARGDRIEVLSYKGVPRNIDAAFSSDAFRARLAGLGVRLDLGEAHRNGLGAIWSDYRHTDLVLAVRNLTIYDADRKPASKLLNAWFADVPALLGPEVAFTEIGRPGIDYRVIRSPNDVLTAVADLKENPRKYRAMIEAGRNRRQAFDDDAVARKWFDLVNGPIGEAFDAWIRRPALSRAFTVLGKMHREPAEVRRHREAFRSGDRILDVAE